MSETRENENEATNDSRAQVQMTSSRTGDLVQLYLIAFITFCCRNQFSFARKTVSVIQRFHHRRCGGRDPRVGVTTHSLGTGSSRKKNGKKSQGICFSCKWGRCAFDQSRKGWDLEQPIPNAGPFEGLVVRVARETVGRVAVARAQLLAARAART